jgi:hypothetical protein
VTVPVDGMGTVSVAPVMAPPVLGMQKPRWVGKRFWDRLVAAPEENVKNPEKGDPLGCGRTAWVQTRRSAAATWAAKSGICSRASLEVTDGDHLIPRPDSDGKGMGAAAQDRIGAVEERLKGWNQASPRDLDKGGGEKLGWHLAVQVGARIVPRQRRSRNMQGFGKIFDNGVNRMFIILQKFIWQDNLCTENCLKLGKDQCLPSAVL